jgi:hypothetical protein
MGASSTLALPLQVLFAAAGRATVAETNHERTLSVPYVFRNHLICSGENDERDKRAINARS